MKLLSTTRVYACPPRASTAYEYEYYGRARGLDKVRLRFLDISNDIFDHGSLSFSVDNGRTWPDSRAHMAGRKTAEGTLRRFDGLGFVDPVNGYLLNLYLEGLFREDDLLEGMTQYYLNVRVSADGGRTSLVDEQVIQKGPPGRYTARHPIEPVWIGRNSISMPAVAPVVRARQGHLVAAVMITVLGPDGRYTNPGGGLTWMEEQILIGRWLSGQPGRIEWDCGPRISLVPEQSTRGLDESTIAEMPDGRLLLVMRASNGGAKDPDFRIPGYKWFAVSADGGFSWTDPRPWGYTDGSPFHSPASMSQLVRHSSGALYWFGNICPANPRANHPRYPLVAVQVDPVSLALLRETTFAVDTRQPDEPEELQLSNFCVHEDRATGELLVHMPRFYPVGGAWTGDTFVYRLSV